MQIAKKHWAQFKPGARALRPEQKRAFALGWLTWMGAETVGVAVAILNLLMVPFVVFVGNIVPDKVLTVPIIGGFVVTLAHFIALYRLRVKITPSAMIGSLFAAMSVQWTIARAVASGLLKDSLPFVVTAKGGAARRTSDFPAFWEAVIGVLLFASAVLIYWTNWERVQEIYFFAGVLFVQSLPFLAAAGLAALEGSRLNQFAFWIGLRSAVVGSHWHPRDHIPCRAVTDGHTHLRRALGLTGCAAHSFSRMPISQRSFRAVCRQCTPPQDCSLSTSSPFQLRQVGSLGGRSRSSQRLAAPINIAPPP